MVKRFSKKQKDAIVAEARQYRDARWTGMDQKLGWCLHSSLATLAILHLHGVKAILQAGTAYWRRAPDKLPGPTFFGYKFEAHNSFMAELFRMLESLPEIHVWVGIVETNEMIDIETCHFPDVCLELIKEDWPAKKPPDYLWTTCDKLPRNCYYVPYKQAIELLGPYIEDLVMQDREVTQTAAGRR